MRALHICPSPGFAIGLSLAVLCWLPLSLSPAAASLDEAEKQQIEGLIQQYIAQNPELIRDALAELERKEERARLDAALSLVRQDEDDPVMGNPNGELTIYEFSDYNCGYCKRLFTTLQDVLAEDSDIKLVVKEFPILAESSVIAARAGIAAQNQGLFPVFHQAMMGSGGRLDEPLIRRIAKDSGLDMGRFDQDVQSTRTTEILRRTMIAAQQLDIRGTPALLIGDTLIPGAISKSEIMALINDLRDAKNR